MMSCYHSLLQLSVYHNTLYYIFVLSTSNLSIRCKERSLISHWRSWQRCSSVSQFRGWIYLIKRSVKPRKEKWQEMAKEEFDKLPMKINDYFNAKTVSWAEQSLAPVPVPTVLVSPMWGQYEGRCLPTPELWITNKLPIMMGWLAGWINTSQHLNEVCYTSSLPDTPLGLQPAPTLITLITGNTQYLIPPLLLSCHSRLGIVIVLEVSGQDRQHWNVASWVKTRLIVFLWWRWMTFIRPVSESRY